MTSGPVFPEGRTISVGGKPAIEQVSRPTNDATPHGQQVPTDQLPKERADATTTRAAKQAAKKALRATPPADAVIPTMGLRAHQYALNKAFGRHDKVPPLGKKEQRLRDERLAYEAQQARATEISTWLKSVFNTCSASVDGEVLRWQGFRGKVSIHNQKGGAAKTTLLAPLANLLARLTKMPVLLLPIANNDGSTTLKGGVNEKNSLDIIQLETLIKELTHDGTITANPADVFAHLAHNDEGVFVVSQKAPPPDFTGVRLRALVRELEKIFPFIFMDGGNAVAQADGAPGGNLEFMAGLLSDLLIFPCSTYMPDSPDKMGMTMDAFHVLRQDTKLSRSLVVANGHRPGVDKEEDWVMFAENKVERNTDGTVRPIGPRDIPIRVAPRVDYERPKAKLILIPWDQHLVENPIPDLDKVTEGTYQVYLEILFEIVQRVAEQRQVDFRLLDQILAADAATYTPDEEVFYSPFDDSGFEAASDEPPTTEQQHPAQDTPSGQAFSAVGHNR